MKIGPLLAHLRELETGLAAELRAAAERHADDHDVYHQCHTFAVTADKRVQKLEPLADATAGKADLAGAPSETAATSCWRICARSTCARRRVATTWVMAAQAAKAARDQRVAVARDRVPAETEAQAKWFTDQDQDRRAAGARGGMTETPGEKAAREELASRTRVTLRPIAGPLALGFFGLAAATFVMSGLQLGWVEPTEGKQVALCILAFTVPLQFTASLLGFLARDGVAATGMGLLSGIWAAIGLVTFTGKPGSTSDALGLFLLVAGVAMWAPASSALGSKLVPALVLSTAGLRFLVTGLYQLTSNEAWEDTAGVIGLLLAGFASMPPTQPSSKTCSSGRCSRSAAAARASRRSRAHMPSRSPNVAHEPGVRQQL